MTIFSQILLEKKNLGVGLKRFMVHKEKIQGLHVYVVKMKHHIINNYLYFRKN